MILSGGETMSITESTAAEYASKQSFSIQALSMLAILSYLSAPTCFFDKPNHHVSEVAYERYEDSTNQSSEVELILQTEEYKIFQAINNVYDDLLTNRTELDNAAQEILYSNLWDLYE